ncbi:hypothetical protein TBLA_0B02050 [Henningerozyma blattae CBS 6284]|uniref:Uncharacterized protein n=1 Tax=Henningerozyma blattae (strain ATCC 34711 / CBS 6284 / DSM 70876 / NBRC 10599 / NRRL Y-10934 / UCD 77-7) TaxID=1071380 RepID=I2GY45_HENB6|nr:hypothetical protein TBLA_0B02050 [Tetrapisispora blattae CBS 6284]CCH59047.1 hypothetical protein TBLA_0B02050 [Tetrapisispora blattae CBS 6284]
MVVPTEAYDDIISLERQPIRVGMIGLHSQSGWAIKSHYPAIMQLSMCFKITALYNKSINQSMETIKDLRLKDAVAYPDLESFVSNSEVEMIVVSTHVVKHYDLLIPILQYATKNSHLKYLFVEWALGCSISQAELIYNEAAKIGIQTIICLQGRKSPYILRAKELINEGALGELNSIEIMGNGGWYGYDRPIKSPAHIYELGYGVDLVTSTFAHTIDILQYITSSYFSKVNAMVFNNIPEQYVVDENGIPTGQKLPKNVPDHLLFQGTLQSGNIPVSCSIKGGKPTKKFTKNLVIDIHGTKGDIKIEGDAGFIEMSNLVLYYSGVKINNVPTNDTPISNSNQNEVMEVHHLRNYNGVLGNIFRLYQAIADFHYSPNGGFKTGKITPFQYQGFEFNGFPTMLDALLLHRLIDNVYKSDSYNSTLDVSNIYTHP